MLVRINIFVILISLNGFLLSQSWFQQQITSDQFKRAVHHFDNGRYATADYILQKVLKKPAGDYTSPVLLLSMKTNLALNRMDDVKSVGKKLILQHSQHDYLDETFMVLGDALITEGDTDGAFRMYLRARQLASEEKFIPRLDDRIIHTIRLNVTDQSISELQLYALGESEIILYLASAYNKLCEGRPDDCAYVLSQVEPLNIPELYMELYEQLLLASYNPGKETFDFGVILPLSGKDSPLGKSFLRGLVQSASEPSRNISIAFQIEDNHSDPVETIRAINRLQKNRHIMGIIAAIGDDASLAAANALQNRTLPLLLPGGNGMSLSTVGERVFQIKADWAEQGRLAARWIAETLKRDSVAIMVPTDIFGQIITDAFLKEMDALDRKVVAIEWYTGKPEDLKKQFQSLREKAFSLISPDDPNEAFLGMSLDSIDAMFDVNTEDFFDLTDDEEEKSKIKDSSKVVLNTIQALYMPIHSEDINYIATQLPMYNLNTDLVGNSDWYQPDVLAQDHISPHLQGMIILTNKYLHLSDQDTKVQLNEESDMYYLGQDISRLLSMICREGIQNRTEFTSRLEQIRYHGLAYSISFSPDDHLNSAMQILKYENRVFMPVGMFADDTIQFYIQQRP